MAVAETDGGEVRYFACLPARRVRCSVPPSVPGPVHTKTTSRPVRVQQVQGLAMPPTTCVGCGWFLGLGSVAGKGDRCCPLSPTDYPCPFRMEPCFSSSPASRCETGSNTLVPLSCRGHAPRRWLRIDALTLLISRHVHSLREEFQHAAPTLLIRAGDRRRVAFIR